MVSLHGHTLTAELCHAPLHHTRTAKPVNGC
jgi:hypothetical protein